MRFNSEIVHWAQNLKVPNDLLKRARAKIASTGGEKQDFYYGFLISLYLAHSGYNWVFAQAVPSINNMSSVTTFMEWLGISFQRAIELIPQDYHWGAEGSPARRTELEIRDLQRKKNQPTSPPNITPMLEELFARYDTMFSGEETPEFFLGAISGWSAAFTNFVDGVAPLMEFSHAPPMFIPAIESYIRAAAEQLSDKPADS